MKTLEKTLAGYMQEIGLEVIIKPCKTPKSAPDWATKGYTNAYRVTSKFQGRVMRSYFYAGKAIQNLEPASVIADFARNWDLCVYSLQEFGDEFGWDSNTYKTYKSIKRIGKRYADFIANTDIRSELAELAMEY